MNNVRKLRRAEARLALLQKHLGSFRRSFYIAIGRGDPAWVKRCHKAVRDQEKDVRDQEERIRSLREVRGLEQPDSTS